MPTVKIKLYNKHNLKNMSTRVYPLYQKGNPQLRVFLSNFWMKLIRPEVKLPPNMVEFHCSMEMTRFDVKNYLEKIYGVKCIEVRTRIEPGKTKRDHQGYVIKEDDRKLAYITMPPNETFEFPNLFPENKAIEDEKKHIEEAKKQYNKFIDKNRERGNIPGWFGV